MPEADCVFCKISAHQAEADVVFENENWIAFHDINPSAPVHVLLVPKQHFCWWDSLSERAGVLSAFFKFAIKVAEKAGVRESGFKLIMNGGQAAGQVIDHFHVHLIGGLNTTGSQKLHKP